MDVIGAILGACMAFFRSRLNLSPAARSAEAETPANGSEPTRSALLDHAADCMASMVRCPGHREWAPQEMNTLYTSESVDRNEFATKIHWISDITWVERILGRQYFEADR
jgi:hypothetical protein